MKCGMAWHAHVLWLVCLQVAVADLAPTSVTEYAWRVKLAMKPPKDPVKFSENATVKSDVEVGAGLSARGPRTCACNRSNQTWACRATLVWVAVQFCRSDRGVFGTQGAAASLEGGLVHML